MFNIDNLILTTDLGTIAFETPIRQVVEYNDLLFVRLALMGRETDINNIYGVKEGEILWRVQDMREFNPLFTNLSRTDIPILNHVPYSQVRIYDRNPNLLVATTTAGFRYLIDPNTGKIVGEESWVK